MSSWDSLPLIRRYSTVYKYRLQGFLQLSSLSYPERVVCDVANMTDGRVSCWKLYDYGVTSGFATGGSTWKIRLIAFLDLAISKSFIAIWSHITAISARPNHRQYTLIEFYVVSRTHYLIFWVWHIVCVRFYWRRTDENFYNSSFSANIILDPKPDSTTEYIYISQRSDPVYKNVYGVVVAGIDLSQEDCRDHCLCGGIPHKLTVRETYTVPPEKVRQNKIILNMNA